MDKRLNKLLERARELGWTVKQEDGNVYNFQRLSPAGQDFNISIDTEDDADWFVNNIHETYESFDCSEEAYLWLDNTGHGMNGAPYDMKDVYEDMEACEDLIFELHNELVNSL